MDLNLAAVHEAVAAAVPDRECLIWRDRSLTWADVTDRTRRLANLLSAHGLGHHGRAREAWESSHDHLALYLLNGNEYLEGMIGAYKARVAPFNVNYRYVADELAHLLNDAGARAVLYHGRFAATLGEVRDRVPSLELLVRVDDGTGDDLLPGAVDYEEALAGAAAHRPDLPWPPDDRYLLYTGGTTGAPKGVLWRQGDFCATALGVGTGDGTSSRSLDELVDRARQGRLRALPAPPFMHGAAHWNALSAWIAGGTVVIQDQVDRLDAADLLATCQRHEVTSLLVVGDAFVRPLLDELRSGDHQLDALRFLLTGGAILSPSLKAELLQRLPHLRVLDVLGSSETGRQGVNRTATAPGSARGVDATFAPAPTTAVLSDDRRRLLEPGDPRAGWLAQRGRVPLGYLGDPAKTATTFPVVDGERFAVAGDRARLTAAGAIELLGRDSVTINSGGEKIFAEEVEGALKGHPSVYDAVVVGRPSERWGQEVVAVVALRPGTEATDEELQTAAGRHLARYKLPKAFIRVDQVQRSPAGKLDYAWALTLARPSPRSLR